MRNAVLPLELPMTERDVEHYVWDCARFFKWERYHTQRSEGSAPGWPDEVLCRPPRLVIAELKGTRGRLSGPQRKWLDLLRRCGGVEAYLWGPAQVRDGTIEEVLR